MYIKIQVYSTLHMKSIYTNNYTCFEKEGRMNQARNKAKQHSTPKAVTCPKKNELPRVGLEPTTL